MTPAWLYVTSFAIALLKARDLRREIAVALSEFVELKVNLRIVHYLLVAYYVVNADK